MPTTINMAEEGNAAAPRQRKERWITLDEYSEREKQRRERRRHKALQCMHPGVFAPTVDRPATLELTPEQVALLKSFFKDVPFSTTASVTWSQHVLLPFPPPEGFVQIMKASGRVDSASIEVTDGLLVLHMSAQEGVAFKYAPSDSPLTWTPWSPRECRAILTGSCFDLEEGNAALGMVMHRFLFPEWDL
jgi:hypothetical protein